MNKWKFCVIDPHDAAVALCIGLMDEGDGKSCGFGYGFGGGGWGDGDGYGDGYGCGYGNSRGSVAAQGWVCAITGRGDGWLAGTSPEEWR